MRIFIISILLASLIFSSCEKNEYEPPAYREMGTVERMVVDYDNCFVAKGYIIDGDIEKDTNLYFDQVEKYTWFYSYGTSFSDGMINYGRSCRFLNPVDSSSLSIVFQHTVDSLSVDNLGENYYFYEVSDLFHFLNYPTWKSNEQTNHYSEPTLTIYFDGLVPEDHSNYGFECTLERCYCIKDSIGIGTVVIGYFETSFRLHDLFNDPDYRFFIRDGYFKITFYNQDVN